MKYLAQIGDRTFEATIIGKPDELRITINDQTFPASLSASGPRLTLRVGDRIIEGFVEATDDGFAVLLEGRTYDVRVTDERTRMLAQLSGVAPRRTGGVIKAPMPGLVKAVLAQPGDVVERGTRLVVLEAMKMENDLAAPESGTVKEVKVSAGDKVDQGQVLVVLE
ncbi:MAG: biotin/lipoyl-binding protein [Dehalococcoidia bacterium]|nr:biotin/lipoyl-binding protein [Dehalococcoidia bacterium]